jgi:hypothetical protein
MPKISKVRSLSLYFHVEVEDRNPETLEITDLMGLTSPDNPPILRIAREKESNPDVIPVRPNHHPHPQLRYCRRFSVNPQSWY